MLTPASRATSFIVARRTLRAPAAPFGDNVVIVRESHTACARMSTVRLVRQRTSRLPGLPPNPYAPRLCDYGSFVDSDVTGRRLVRIPLALAAVVALSAAPVVVHPAAVPCSGESGSCLVRMEPNQHPCRGSRQTGHHPVSSAAFFGAHPASQYFPCLITHYAATIGFHQQTYSAEHRVTQGRTTP